jgi:hypothetical protein
MPMTRFCRFLQLFTLVLLLALPDAPGTMTYAYADSPGETLEDNVETAEIGSMGHINRAVRYIAQLPVKVLSLGRRMVMPEPARAPFHAAVAAAMLQYIPLPQAPPPRLAAVL